MVGLLKPRLARDWRSYGATYVVRCLLADRPAWRSARWLQRAHGTSRACDSITLAGECYPDGARTISPIRRNKCKLGEPSNATGYTGFSLGGYDAIAAVVDDLLPRLSSDALLGRFWTSPRSVDTHNRERQLAVDFVAASAGGPTYYLGRDMKLAHEGMGITKEDYAAFMRCLSATMDAF